MTDRIRISTLDPDFWADGMVGTVEGDSDPVVVTLDDGTSLILPRDDVLFIGDNPA